MKIFVFLCFALFIAGCSNTPKIHNIPDEVGFEVIEYKMGVGDLISVQVWQTPDLSVAVPVRPDGKISVPLVGDVLAAGKSTKQLSDELTLAFATYVRSPQVTIIVTDPVSANFLRRVRVTGAVEQPLSIPHQQGMTVLDLVLLAGGLTEFASGGKAKLYRKYGDTVKVFSIELDDILDKGQLETNYLLSPADVVTVPERLF
jgi:polysaccharide export outer membrane protein